MEQKNDINNHFDFKESQRLTNWLVWTLTLGTMAFMIAILFYQLFTGNKVGNNPASNGILTGFILIYYLPAISLMLYARLTVCINQEAIYYGWNIPTKKLNKLNWEEVQSCEIIKYYFVGYGYRLTKKYGIVYNTKGNKGLLITKKSGQKVLLGSLRTNELATALENISLVNHHMVVTK